MYRYIIGLFALFFIQACFTSAQSPVWTSEAEHGQLLGSTSVLEGCVNASGGGYFVQVGNEKGNGLQFSNIEIEEAGNYKLIVSYFNASNLNMDVLVNGQSYKIVEFPASNWCYQGSAGQIEVPLYFDKGTHTLSLMVHDQKTAPLLDKLSLVRVGNIERNPITFFVSNSNGNDTWSGMYTDSAIQSLQAVNDLMLTPGDSVLFKAGDTFYGQLNIQYSGSKEKPIYFGRYGDGMKPVLDGAKAAGGAFYTTVLIKNQSNIEIADLEISNNRLISRTGNNDEVGYGVYVWNNGVEVMKNFHFHHLTIRNVYAISTEGVEFNLLKVAGIYLRSERNTVIGEEKHIRDVEIDSCFITRTGKFGIWSQHAGGDLGVGNDSLNRNMNFVLKNNHFFETGGSGITPGGTYNCLVENNIFEYTGSNADPRMAKRGSGAWFFNCRNVIAQYNKSLHVRGPADSYGMHIDFGNKNVFLQYNYSEDSEGGFVEILGKNVNSVYRFNVSVNDGIRDVKGNSIWISDYAGSDNRVRSDSNYVYNNTIYTDADITPDIFIKGKTTFIYNNIFCALSNSKIGEEVSIDIEPGSDLLMSNNSFTGQVSEALKSNDSNPFIGDPLFADAGANNSAAYKIKKGSIAFGNGLPFAEPVFPMAGKGIFKHISSNTGHDMFGNEVVMMNGNLNIGAYNGDATDIVGTTETQVFMPQLLRIFPNPVKNKADIQFTAKKTGGITCSIHSLQGRLLYKIMHNAITGNNKWPLELPSFMTNGIYILKVEYEEKIYNQPFILNR